ncbi:gastrin/cholecystokinin-like peptide [Corythoichthys intestinalis]|uniref:gastrin/cholecystokinin-like peptide n=1 Tax=Corythoichthys intestinalis TaxID=161448 RepID=UPI0025A63B75|nr:gastrin/cholecystokinin-like peptide [Corythoichthys intestinalis]
MSGNKMATFTLGLVLLSCATITASGKIVEQLPVARNSEGRQEPLPPRTERWAHLSEDQRVIITKQIMQAISEMVNSDCLLERDYQGWLDFGRRDAE